MHVVLRNNMVWSCISFTQVPSMLISCKTISQYDKQDINIGTENILDIFTTEDFLRLTFYTVSTSLEHSVSSYPWQAIVLFPFL